MITKSDYLKFLTCQAYFWFYKKKPDALVEQEINDFQKELIKSGQEVEAWGRKLFPGGVLVESMEGQAVIDTKKLLDDGQKVIFQATIEAEGLYVMVDMLEWDDKKKYWIINEAKGSTSDKAGESKSKKEHLYDASFQYVVLKLAGLKVGKVNLLELNKEFVKKGEINPVKLIVKTDITEDVDFLENEINRSIESMRMLMEQENEPMPCECIYKSRANHCPAFKHLYPDMPEYTVHDIVRIGSSLKRLEGLIEGDYVSIYDVPVDFGLTEKQRNHVNVAQLGNTICKSILIKKELDKMEYPFYYFDYETYPIQREPFGEFEHMEFLHTDGKINPMKALAESLKKHIGDSGSIIVWNQKFEKKCNENIGEVFPEYVELMEGYNERLLYKMRYIGDTLEV